MWFRDLGECLWRSCGDVLIGFPDSVLGINLGMATVFGSGYSYKTGYITNSSISTNQPL